MKQIVGSKATHGEVRNKLLRRADWRFLLPNHQPAKSICFANGLLRKAVELISDRVVDAQIDPHGDCDLAVAVDPDYRTLRAAYASLHPGGSCYTEWYSPLAGGPKGIRRRLETAGFKDVTCYWCRPHLPRSEYWLPVDAPGALRYYLSNRAPARNVIHRILRVVWLLCFRVGLMFPVCATTRKPAFLPAGHERFTAGPSRSVGSQPLDASGVTPDLHSTIRTHWKSWGFGPTPGNLSSLMLTGGSSTLNKVVALVFAEPDHHPRLAVKIARVPEIVPWLTEEATTLQAIQARRGGVRGAPRVLFSQKHAGLFMVGETALTGRRLSTLVRRSNYRDLALQATDWLSDLAGRSDPCPPAIWWDRLVEPVLADLSEASNPIIDRGMLKDTRDILATLGALPLVCEHHDFTPWNTLITPNGELVVLDWEYAELQGLPALDLIYFLTYLAFHLDGEWNRESYRATLDRSTFTGGVLSECLARYARQTGLDDAAMGPLRLLVWVRRACWEDPRRALFISLWEEELRYTTRI